MTTVAEAGLRIAGETLQATGVTMRFGGHTALGDATLTAQPGAVTSLIGPNGAGKTTMFNCLTGLLTPSTGTVTLGGRDLSGLTPDARARAGMARTFQRLEVFGGLSVAENLQVAIEAPRVGGLFRSVFSLRHRSLPADLLQVEQTLAALGISDLAQKPAGSLSTGMSRLVELGRALCTQPKVLLIDEGASGLDAPETERLQEVLVGLADAGLTILLVEHDVELVMALSTQIYVLDFGKMIESGPPEDIMRSDAVRAAYLGVDDEEEIDA